MRGTLCLCIISDGDPEASAGFNWGTVAIAADVLNTRPLPRSRLPFASATPVQLGKIVCRFGNLSIGLPVKSRAFLPGVNTTVPDTTVREQRKR